MTGHEHEILVIGGGPAGATAAGLLSDWGHEVRVVTRAEPSTGWLAESVPASARKLLDSVGVLQAIDGAQFVPNEGNTVWWAGRPERAEPFEGAAGFHARRGALEEVLLSVAEQRGASVRRGAPVRAVEREKGGWIVRVGDESMRARWVLDASGRAGVLAKRVRTDDRPTGTVALCGHWRHEGGWRGDDRNFTLIESHEGGWAWSVPVSRDVRCVTAMVDPRAGELARGADLAATLDAELGHVPGIASRLVGADRVGEARACSAALYTAERFADDGALLVGDAGSFIDPLSSYGVKKAIASGWLASIALHTAITDPAMASTALDFFDRREREIYRRYRELSLPFFDEAASAYGTRFWTARAEAARNAAGPATRAPGGSSRSAVVAADPADAVGASDADRFVGDLDVREAYEEIRRRPGFRAGPGPGLERVDLPLVRGRRVVLDPHLVTPAMPEGVRYVRNVDLARLVELAPMHDDVPEIFAAYNGADGAAELGDFLAALAFAVGKGFLDLADWRPTSRSRTIST